MTSGSSAAGIHYEATGSGEPVLLVPGWAGSARELTPVRDALADRYRVIAADPPGSGLSRPQPRRYTASYLEEDARSLLGLLDELNATPAHVVGYSDGGEYALLMAEIDPTAVRSIVAWGAAGRVVLSTEFLDIWADAVDDPIPALRAFSEYLGATYGVENARLMIRSHAAALRAIVEAGGDLSRKDAGTIRCPVLLMTGEQDRFFAPPAVVSDLAAAMPRADFVKVEGAGHAVHRDRPAWLVDTITEWLDGLRPGAGVSAERR